MNRLQELLKPGMPVYTILRHRSKSGLMRIISVVIVTQSGGITDITHLVEEALGYKSSNVHQPMGMIVKGTGTDMGFHVVYGLSNVLFNDGHALKHHWL